MLLYNLEGPKGVGKSTIGDALSKYYKNKDELNIYIRHFDSRNILTNDILLESDKKDYIFDRGLLSYQLYDWLWNNGLSEYYNKDYLGLSIQLKQPVNKMHFDYLMEKVKYKYIILYSSDEQLLFDRIKRREELTGKGMNQLEKDTLVQSNKYFEMMGYFLQYLYPEKVLLIDVTKFVTVDNIVNYIIQQSEK